MRKLCVRLLIVLPWKLKGEAVTLLMFVSADSAGTDSREESERNFLVLFIPAGLTSKEEEEG